MTNLASPLVFCGPSRFATPHSQIADRLLDVSLSLREHDELRAGITSRLLALEPEDLAGVHDVQRVQRLLDGSHHVQRALAGFLLEKVHFVQAHAVLVGAGAAHANGAGHELAVELLGALALAGVELIMLLQN